MKSTNTTFQSLIFLCFTAPALLFSVDHEPVDIEGSQDASGVEQQSNFCCSGNPTNTFLAGGTYLPVSAHVVAEVSALGDELQLEDGSTWKVDPYDCQQALGWLRQGAPVTVLQNKSWFSSYQFCIQNKATGAVIAANLFQGPWKDQSQYVIEFDLHLGTVKLSNPKEITRWKIHSSDLARFAAWNFQDAIPIIIGHNADFDPTWNSGFEAFLINVRDTKNSVRAHQY